MTAYSVEQLARVRRLASSGEARRIRIAFDITQAEIAAEVGVSMVSVCNWERGHQRPTGDQAIKYLEVLDKLAALENVAA